VNELIKEGKKKMEGAQMGREPARLVYVTHYFLGE
jgi:hypothetical protein